MADQRGYARQVDGDGNGSALCDLGASEFGSAPLLTIGDASVTEVTAGTSSLVFHVTLSAGSTQTVTVDYATADGLPTVTNTYSCSFGFGLLLGRYASDTLPATVRDH